MKKFFALILFFLSITAIHAQEQKVDVIIKSDGTKIEAVVTEVDVDLIKYKLANNLMGPTYSLKKDDIASVLYSNGTSEVFPKRTSNVSVTNGTYNGSAHLTGLALEQYNNAKALNTAGSVLWAVGSITVFTGLFVGLFASMYVGFIIMMPVGGGLLIPGAVMSGIATSRMNSIRSSGQAISLYDFNIGKNLKHPVNLALHTNGISLKF